MKKWINYLPAIFIGIIVASLLFYTFQSPVEDLSFSEFQKIAETADFQDSTLEINSSIVNVEGSYIEDGRTVEYSVIVPNTDENLNWLMENLEADGGTLTIKDPDSGSIWLTLLIQLLPLIFIAALYYFMFARMNGGNKAFDFTKSKARMEENVPVRFKDVAGCDEEKEEVKEIIDYLKAPERFTQMGAHIPKGVLMVGPPGTGKTLLAKAVAGEAHVPFYSISGSDFVEMFVGTGASRVRDMFKKAQQTAPCILFIDEIDAVGRERGAGMGGGNDEREQTLNQLLVEMDGMSDNNGIVIIAATNRPDVLDPALMRSGRFDRRITVNLPDVKGREAILQVHARNKHLARDISLEGLAKRTPGFSGADLANVLNEGAILAVRNRQKTITQENLDEAIDRVMMGPAKKSKKYTENDKWLVAYHEAGHAVIGLMLEDADQVQKVTIIPRGEAGGYNLMTPKEEKYFHRKSEMIAQITGLLGGRTAEELVFQEISAGAVNDIERLTKLAKNMVRVYGMSSLGPIQYADPQGAVFLGRDFSKGSDYSNGIATEIDREVRDIVDSCHQNARRILEENRDLLDLIARNLFEHETLTHEEIMNLKEYGTLHHPDEVVETEVKEELLDLSKPSVEDEKAREQKEAMENQAIDDALMELTKKKD